METISGRLPLVENPRAPSPLAVYVLYEWSPNFFEKYEFCYEKEWGLEWQFIAV